MNMFLKNMNAFLKNMFMFQSVHRGDGFALPGNESLHALKYEEIRLKIII